jgi:glycine C-acetyltransferase
MYTRMKECLLAEIEQIKAAGLYKDERILVSPQSAEIQLDDGRKVLNFCANNYLGLADHPELIKAANDAFKTHGYGMASVRFICGTTDLHKILERKIAEFFGTDDTILYAACFDANGGVFEPLLDPKDAIISDSLNHASIIDGVRLCKAELYRYSNANMEQLEERLIMAREANYRMIVTDGVFSMDGNVAPMDKIVELADKYDALVMVDECHSAGVVGATGRGVTELFNLRGKVEIITGTLGKAFGGALGGFTTGKKEIIEFLRQRSRPYLFSNSLPPAIVAAGIRMFDMIAETGELHEKLHFNTNYFIGKLTEAGFDLKPTRSAICAIMLYDAVLAKKMADMLLDEGIYVVGFSFPVVPRDEARIRVQLSAAHSIEHLDRAIEAFSKVGKKLGVIS